MCALAANGQAENDQLRRQLEHQESIVAELKKKCSTVHDNSEASRKQCEQLRLGLASVQADLELSAAEGDTVKRQIEVRSNAIVMMGKVSMKLCLATF